ncbi:hypothetical protein CTheo_6449 [Ceratobasidium theobromae]|uniref:Transmembrane protein n=1 Tax=Ceratobasidium theobromae TaxID=1582974 RepID=A0A5N5QFM4_9AGAM|nr:hypothetical protein CTheo_6449 [Ceratobasidium theobromae]
MKFVIVGLLFIISLVTALDVPLPHHAVAEILVIPENVTIMTPRQRKPVFEQQLFDFGSAQNGFSELGNILKRQQNVVEGGGVAVLRFGVMAMAVVMRKKMGAMARDVVPKLHNVARVAVAVRVATGFTCYRDMAGNPLCRDPNPADPSTSEGTSTTVEATSMTVEATSTTISETSAIAISETSTTISETSTTVEVMSTTIEGSSTQVSSPNSEPSETYSQEPDPTVVTTSTTEVSEASITPEVNTAINSPASSQTGETGVANVTKSSTNIGAIVGGSVGGVVALGVLILIVVLCIRKRANETSEAREQAQNDLTPQPYPRSLPPGASWTVYSGTVPPTPRPGTADPFLTPVDQAQSLGVSYTPGTLASSSPPAAATSPIQYAGLPEPQQPDGVGVNAGAPYMPISLNGHSPQLNSMIVTPVQRAGADESSVNRRLRSSLTSGPSPPGPNTSSFASYTDSARSVSNPGRLSNPSAISVGPAYANPGYAGPNPGSTPRPAPRPGFAGIGAGIRASYDPNPPPAFPLGEPYGGPSAVNLPSSRASGYGDAHSMHSAPRSPPPPGVHGGEVGVGGSGTTPGPPPPGFAPGEKQVYRRSLD